MSESWTRWMILDIVARNFICIDDANKKKKRKRIEEMRVGN